ncbi:hypothetical protein [Azospirillum sp. ST 5-10]|uniref:hypothetical protein n=1 Tax=unclassified Azospirillum TaxID=2630922 RepID=UPI003F4A228D
METRDKTIGDAKAVAEPTVIFTHAGAAAFATIIPAVPDAPIPKRGQPPAR